MGGGTIQVLKEKYNFDYYFRQGRRGENHIANWLIGKGWDVLPVYEVEGLDFKGPRFFTAKKQYIAPDMLIIRDREIRWIEAKHKSVFTWFRAKESWQTGIDKHHWTHYLELSMRHPEIELWILFLHREWITNEGDGHSPIGLFGNTVRNLAMKIDHSSDKWGNSGMVYWNYNDLVKLADLDEVLAD